MWPPSIGPIIGVMMQPLPSRLGRGNYLPSSYVKWIELAGGRVVPLAYDWSDEQMEDAFKKVNGALYIGGGAGPSPASRRLFALAKTANENGDYFPVWGTCDGFEWLSQFAAEDDGILTPGFDSENLTLPLNLTVEAAHSRILKEAAATRIQGYGSILDAMTSLPITMNNHVQGLTLPKYFSNSKLKSFFNVIATGIDRKGQEFVAAIEHPTLPFWGVQFHPEKNIFEWGVYLDSGMPYEVIAHSRPAIAMSQFMANYFVDECRKSKHAFPDGLDAWNHLIYQSTNATSLMFAPGFVEAYVLREPGSQHKFVEKMFSRPSHYETAV